jgi:anti-sigma28 factor (negative regulator of flagellin synthesis)
VSYERMTEKQLRRALLKVQKQRAAAEKKIKTEQLAIQAELDRREGLERLRQVTEGMSDEQRVEMLKALKAGG